MQSVALEDANERMRAAVAARMAATPADDPKMQGYVTEPMPETFAAEVLKQRKFYGSVEDVHPTSQRFFELCDALKAMHASKSRDYGCPTGTDPLANIRNGAKFVGIQSWKGAMVRLSDKVTRLATFNATGTLSHEGVEDNLLDLASYALLSLLLYQEERGR